MAVSLVFQGEDIVEVNNAILDYVRSGTSPLVEEPKPTQAEMRPIPKAKAKAKAKTKVTENVEFDSIEGAKKVGAPDDPMDLFGDDPVLEDPAAGEEDDQFGATDPTIEDVKNALGAVVSAWDEKDNTGAAKAQKVLRAYGKADDLGTLKKDLYREVIEKSDFVAEKANG